MGTYNRPVAGLLTLGRPDTNEHPVDYQTLGLTFEHVPDLLRLLRDKELLEYDEKDETEDPKWFAHIHAWRALAQLRTAEAVEPFLDVIDENEDADDWSDWIGEELPELLGQFGVSILPQVLSRIEQRKGQLAASAFANVLVQIAQQHPESRTEVVFQLCRLLESAATNDPTLNGFLIGDLLDLKAKEAWPSIEVAFTTGHVDRSIAGDAADVKYALGLGPLPVGRFVPPKASPHLLGQNAKQRFNERQRKKKLAKKKNKKKRK